MDRGSRVETYFDAPCTIEVIEIPTHVLYKADLSWTMAKLYTSSLISKVFIIIEGKDGSYRLTEKGNKVAQQYLAIKKDLDLIAEKIV